MPNSKSAIKRLKTSEEAHVRNQATKSKITTYKNKIAHDLVSGDKEAAMANYRQFCSAVDLGVKHNVIQRNTADRKKSRTLKAITTHD